MEKLGRGQEPPALVMKSRRYSPCSEVGFTFAICGMAGMLPLSFLQGRKIKCMVGPA